MIRVVTAALLLCVYLACGGDAPRRTSRPSESYIIKSTVADQARRAVTIVISVDSQSSEADVKAATEDVIAKHKTQYPSIIVKSHLMSAETGGPPYATSVLEGGVITHSFNPQSASEKIRTH